MRVVSGTARGTKLLAPEGTSTRPTADSIKESLFNILSPNIVGAVFLDLFSGSGAIGIEALSRGAEKSIFVENSPNAVEIIKKNLIKTRLTDSSIIYNIDVSVCIDEFVNKNRKFNIIFMDSPYKMSDINPMVGRILQGGILAQDGILVLEHGRQTTISAAFPYEVVRKKDYGKETSISFIKKSLDITDDK